MRCNKFDEIMRYLHFADDTNLSTDRYCKIRPLVEDLNGAFKQAVISENSSIDETMIPYMIPSAEIRNCLYASVKLPKWACSYSVQLHLQSKMPSTFIHFQTSHWPKRTEKRYSHCGRTGDRRTVCDIAPRQQQIACY